MVCLADWTLCAVGHEPLIDAFLVELMKALDGLYKYDSVVSDLMYIWLETNSALFFIDVLFQAVLYVVLFYLVNRH